MTPDVPRVLNGVFRALLTETLPQVSDPYAIQTTSIAAMLSGYAAQEFDRAASRRVEEIAAMRAIFHRAVPVVTDAELAKALESAGRDEPVTDVRVSALQSTNDWLRGLLVRLHAHIEEVAGEDARQIEEAIWEELAESTRRRHLDPPA
jgi:hypothetical protein